MPSQEEIKECEKCIDVEGKYCFCQCHWTKLFAEKGERIKFMPTYVMCYPEEAEAVKDFLNS